MYYIHYTGLVIVMRYKSLFWFARAVTALLVCRSRVGGREVDDDDHHYHGPNINEGGEGEKRLEIREGRMDRTRLRRGDGGTSMIT